jgi:hypothetical protein
MADEDGGRLEGVRQTLRMMSVDLRFAMRLQAVWDRCADKGDILDRMRGTYEGAAFDAARDGLHMSLVQSVMRPHDTSKGAASFPRLFNALKRPETARAIQSRAWASRVGSAALISSAQSKLASSDVTQWVAALKTLRDEYIAHSSIEQGDHGAKYGFEGKLLAVSISAFSDLDLAVNNMSNGFDDEMDEYEAQADAFWKHVALPGSDDEA